MNLSKAQLGQFWRVFEQACRNIGLDKAGREVYRRRVIKEETGHDHLGEIDATGDFDAVMTHFALDAGDYALAGKYSTGVSGRYRKLVFDRVADILAASGSGATKGEYVAGILFQGRLVYRPFDTAKTFGAKLDAADGSAWTDIPTPTLRLLLQIVTTEWRKLQKA